MNEIFNKLGIELEGVDLKKIKNITVNIQDSDFDDIVFYKIGDNADSEELFFKRLGTKKPGLLITNRNIIGINNFPHIAVNIEEFEKLQISICDYLYRNTVNQKIIAVTGTNGKSTVVHLCQQLLNHNGYKTISIGTVGIYSDKEFLGDGTGTTTPSYVDLRRILNSFKEYDIACVEVSSHALEQRRLYDIRFDIVGWTNISQDHLDYHKTMEEYFKAKLKITKSADSKLLIPYDENTLINLLNENNVNFETSSMVNVKKLNKSFKLDYNSKNISLAKSLCEKLVGTEVNISPTIEMPKGRYTTIEHEETIFVVDYAHTPDAMRNVLKETRKAFGEYEIVTLFGCGGDRDKLKRPLMLDAALEFSSRVVITTDNPRSEKPSEIILDILGNRKFDNDFVDIVEDRKKAIDKYVQCFNKKTVVLIVGKGHEEYQDIKGEKIFFSDIAAVEEAIGKIENED